MIATSIVLAALVTAAPSASETFVYLKPSVAPVPAACKNAKAVAGLVQVPLFGAGSAPCPAARIEDEVITVGELTDALAGAHEGREAAPGAAGKLDRDVAQALERLIQVRLIVGEAEGMGMADVPEAKKALETFDERVLRLALESEATAGVKADPAEVERLYRDAVREWKVKSVLFEKQADAKAFVAAVRKGGDFDALAKKAVADKKAKGGGDAEWMGSKSATPDALKLLVKAKVGAVNAPLALKGGYAVVRVDEVRYPDDPKARTWANEAALARQKEVALEKLYDELVRKYARIDEALLKKIDWEAKKPGYKELAKDKRVLATIQGEAPVTVADLTAEVSLKFFHGLDQPIKEKRVNKEKTAAFRKLMANRLFLKEARARKLQDSEAVKLATADYRRSVLFGTFVEKVLVPGVKVSEADAQAHYERTKAQYTYPQMYRLDALPFGSAAAAQGALDRLRSGTDFQWMRANADGQVPAGARALQVDPNVVVTATSLPPELGKALAGAGTGDYRLYAASDKEVDVVRVVESIPSRAQPYLEVREAVARAAFDEKMKAAVKEYADKLRAVHPVEVYVARIGG